MLLFSSQVDWVADSAGPEKPKELSGGILAQFCLAKIAAHKDVGGHSVRYCNHGSASER
jgi:hypothetical protein